MIKTIAAFCCAILLIAGASLIGYTAISSVSGLAVAQSSTQWNNLKDAGSLTGDAQTSGLISSGLLLFNGSTWDRLRGDTTNGIFVNAKQSNPVKATVIEPTYIEGSFNPISTNLQGGTRVTIGNGGYVGTNGTTWASSPTQAPVKFNTLTTGAANTAVTATLTAGASGTRTMLERVDARCSAGTSNITVQDGATTIWNTQAAEVTAGPPTYSTRWNPPLASSNAAAITITLAACGAGNTGTLIVQGDRQ